MLIVALIGFEDGFRQVMKRLVTPYLNLAPHLGRLPKADLECVNCLQIPFCGQVRFWFESPKKDLRNTRRFRLSLSFSLLAAAHGGEPG